MSPEWEAVLFPEGCWPEIASPAPSQLEFAVSYLPVSPGEVQKMKCARVCGGCGHSDCLQMGKACADNKHEAHTAQTQCKD